MYHAENNHGLPYQLDEVETDNSKHEIVGGDTEVKDNDSAQQTDPTIGNSDAEDDAPKKMSGINNDKKIVKSTDQSEEKETAETDDAKVRGKGRSIVPGDTQETSKKSEECTNVLRSGSLPNDNDEHDAGLKKCPIEVVIKNTLAPPSVSSPQPAGSSSDLDKNVPVFSDDDDTGLKKCPIEDDYVKIKNNPASSSDGSPQSAGNSSDLEKNVPVFSDDDDAGLKKCPIEDDCVEIKNNPASSNVGSPQSTSDLNKNVPIFADAGVQCKRSNETGEDIIGLKKYQ